MYLQSIKRLAAGLRAKQFSSVELTQTFLSRIDKHRDLNSYVTVTPEIALEAAKQADTRIAAGGGGYWTVFLSRTKTSSAPWA